MSTEMISAPSAPADGERRDDRPAWRSEELSDAFQEFARTHDPELRSRLVEAHQGFAYALASRFSARHEASEDLNQAALVGLLHAVDRFDPTRGIQFSTFAWPTIMGEIKRHFRDRTWAVRVPRRLQEIFLATSEAIDELTQDHGRSPSIAEIAERTGLAETEVIEAMEARRAYRLTSLDAPVGDDGESTLQLANHEAGFGRLEQSDLVGNLVARLSRRDREIVRLRFVEERTQAEIARSLGVSPMQVSRLLAQILHQLRTWAAEQR